LYHNLLEIHFTLENEEENHVKESNSSSQKR